VNVANTTDCKVGNKYNVLVGFSVTDTACLIMNFVHTTLYEVNNADISRSKKYWDHAGGIYEKSYIMQKVICLF